LLRRRPALTYFLLTFAISWLGALIVAAPYLLLDESLPKLAGIIMFPVMLLGPSIAGLVLQTAIHGASGLRALFARMRSVGPRRWLLTIAIPPALIFAVLCCLSTVVSPAFTPNHFFIGVSFGCVAGFLEEIGWTGFAFPALRSGGRSAFAASIPLGLLWSAWHIPAVDFLGAVTPHGAAWPLFFAGFTLVLTALRVIICWICVNTESVLMAQLLHGSSTGALVAFSPPGVSATQEAYWYGLYGLLLWIVAAVIVARTGPSLVPANR